MMKSGRFKKKKKFENGNFEIWNFEKLFENESFEN